MIKIKFVLDLENDNGFEFQPVSLPPIDNVMFLHHESFQFDPNTDTHFYFDGGTVYYYEAFEGWREFMGSLDDFNTNEFIDASSGVFVF